MSVRKAVFREVSVVASAMALDPCPEREISYWGRVSCRPVDAVTRAVLPAAAIGGAYSAMMWPGPQYETPLREGVARGVGGGAMFGAALVAAAYTKEATDSNAAALAVAGVGGLVAWYGAVRIGAIPLP